ncbi:GNAT family N-acetyltransferase [bacterium]|nr:GNAT family N-acetyltransferase [bacterium]
MINFEIRKATENDFAEILKMINELATFEKAPEKVTNTVELMNTEKELFNCYIAISEIGEIIGMALYFFAYFTWIGKSLYLDDLYVKSDFRGNGVAKKLLDKIFETAQKERCKRVRWQVLNWNENAINLYKTIGAKIDNEWSNCDFDESYIKNFNTQNHPIQQQ